MTWRSRLHPPTLRVMAANPDPARAPAQPYARKWTQDPMVLCSRRARIIPFPTVLLLREPSESDRAAIAAPLELGRSRDESHMTVVAGVNFLGAFTTAWDPVMVRAGSAQQAPKSPPPADHCIIVAPYSRNVNLDKRPGFIDRETGLLRPEAVHEGWLRVVAWLRAQEQAQIDGPTGQANVPLFTTEPGFDAPEFVLCPLSEVLSQRTDAGRHAYAHAQAALPHAKDGAHLGALHDYAVRVNTGWTLVAGARARAAAAPALMRQTA